ncbi:MAG TPA: glycosyltransferase family 2 protein [Fibrobacteria bacterium]|nr:glycosyltransferase family 2 protein [Fibrobacteria bacterium]
MNLSIVVPAWNEAQSLPELFSQIRAALADWNGTWEVIVVDDGSRDDTFAVVREAHARDSRIRGVRFRHNAGKAAALATGFATAQGGYVITMDGDLQDDPAEIRPLMDMLDSGWDMVSGWKQVRNDPVDKTLPSRFFNGLVRRVSGLKLHDFNCGLKAYRREVLPSLRLYGQMHRLLPVMAHWDGFRVTEKVVNHRARQFGVSKYGWSRGFHGLFDLLTLWFLHRYLRRPLHLFGSIGLVAFVVGALPIPWFAMQWILTGALRVRPLLLLSVGGIILGVQFLSLGLLAELIQSRERTGEGPVAERV